MPTQAGLIDFTAKQQYGSQHSDRANIRRPRTPERHDVFIGRDSELAHIGAALDGSDAKRVAIVAVQGMAGVGKTYLAREFYARHAGRFGSYQHVVLDPERPGTVATWMTVLGEQAGVDATRTDEATIAEVLRAQRTLVHVDNVDSTAAAELVAALSRALGGVSIIVTGRFTELGTAKGSGWTRVELVPLDPMTALSLLQAELEGAGTAVPEAELSELAHQASGLPLALHLAAGYLRRGVTVERFLARLREQGFALDPRDPADHVLRERARGVLATSFAISREQMLAEAGAQAEVWEAALVALGWAPQIGFGRSLGAAITALDKGSGAFEDFIDAAVALSLARRLRPEERDTVAWAVHPLLGEFLRAKTERTEIDARIGAWVVGLADDVPSDQASRWEELSTEAMSIGEWLGAATNDTLGEVLPRAWGFATSRGPVGPWLAAAQRLRRDGTTRGVLWALCQLASRAGELETACNAATEMERLAREADDDCDRALALGQIADVQFDRGEFDEVLRIRHGEQLPIYERLGDVRERALTLRKITDVLAIRGELDKALRIRREEVLPVLEQLGDMRERAITLGKIADVLAIRGELDEALRIHREEELPVYERLGDVWSRTIALGKIADVLFVRCKLDEALRIRYEEQLPVYERLGDVRSRATVMGKIADVLFARGELHEALRIRREEQLPVYERLGDVRSCAITLGKIADILFARGELHEALRIRREEQLPVYERLGDVRSRAITLGKIADVLAIRGELDEALRIRREEELPVYERLGDVRSRAITMGQIADVLFVREELDEALRIRGEEELPAYERLGDVAAYEITLGKIVDLMEARDKFEKFAGAASRMQMRGYIGAGIGTGNTMLQGSSSLRFAGPAVRQSGIRRGDEREEEREDKRFDYVRTNVITLEKVAELWAADGQLYEPRPTREHLEEKRLDVDRARAIKLGNVADVLIAHGTAYKALGIRRKEDGATLDEALWIRREEELPMYERLGDVRARAVTLRKIAEMLTDRGEIDGALTMWRESLAVFEELGESNSIETARQRIARLLARSEPGEDHAGRVNACVVTADGRRVISASGDGTMKIWDLESGRTHATLAGHAGGVRTCAVTADGQRVVSASSDRTLKVWDLESGRSLATLEGHAGGVWACAVTVDGRRAVSTSSDRTLKLWDLESGRALATLEGHTDWVKVCAVTADWRRVVSASDDRTLKLWDLESGRVLATLEGHADLVRACVVTADGRNVVSASEDRTLKIWDLKSGRGLATLEGHTGGVGACAVTVDGRRVVSASEDRTLRIWDLKSGRALATLEGHTGGVNACAMTMDGRRVVSASDDGTLKVWDLATHACLCTHRGDTAYTAVAAPEISIVAGDATGALWFLDWPGDDAPIRLADPKPVASGPK